MLGAIYIWDYTTPTQPAIRTIQGHGEEVSSLAYSPDGTCLVSASSTQVAIWDIAHDIQEVRRHNIRASSLAFSLDGIFVAAGLNNGNIRVWNLKTGEIHTREFTGTSWTPDQILWTSDSTRIVTRKADRALCWDVYTGTTITFEGHTDYINSMHISHGEDRLIISSDDYTARIWDMKTGAELVTLVECDAPVCSASFSRDDCEVVNADANIVVADSFTGTTKHALTVPDLDEEYYYEGAHPVAVVSTSGRFVALANGPTQDGASVFDYHSGRLIADDLGSYIDNVHFSMNDEYLLASSEDCIRVFTL